MKRQLIGIAVVLLVTVGHGSFAQDHSGQYPAADIAAGSRVYAANCASCHGATGVGVGGIDLRRGRLPRAATDEALAALVAAGIPGTGMPSFRLTSDEMRGLIAFVRGGLGVDPNAPPVKLGNAARGRTIFEGEGRASAATVSGPPAAGRVQTSPTSARPARPPQSSGRSSIPLAACGRSTVPCGP